MDRVIIITGMISATELKTRGALLTAKYDKQQKVEGCDDRKTKKKQRT
jgi:hypothetical protein